MKSFVKRVIMNLAALLLVAAPGTLVLSPIAHAQLNENVCDGVNILDGQGGCEGGEGQNSFGTLAKRIVDIFSIVVGAVSVIMIIIGGFRYIISNGDSTGVQGAKNTILYAIVGLVIVLFAQVIVRFVLTNATQDR